LSVVTAAFLYAAAAAGEPDVSTLAEMSETRGYGQILARAETLLAKLNGAKASAEVNAVVAGADEQLAYALDREKQSVSSTLRVVAPENRDTASEQIRPALTRLGQFADMQRSRVEQAARVRLEAFGSGPEGKAPQTKPSAEAARIVVQRKRFGTIPLDDLPQDQWEGQPSGAWATVPTIALYWCDGKRSLAEVARLTQLELGPTNFDFVSYFRFLRKHGYVEFARE
jgi:hypothetical protein